MGCHTTHANDLVALSPRRGRGRFSLPYATFWMDVWETSVPKHVLTPSRRQPSRTQKCRKLTLRVRKTKRTSWGGGSRYVVYCVCLRPTTQYDFIERSCASEKSVFRAPTYYTLILSRPLVGHSGCMPIGAGTRGRNASVIYRFLHGRILILMLPTAAAAIAAAASAVAIFCCYSVAVVGARLHMTQHHARTVSRSKYCLFAGPNT